MKKETLIKIGDRFVAEKGNFFDGIIITIHKVQFPTSRDGYGYWKTEKLMRRKKNHSAKIWWLLEHCTKLK